MKTSRYRDGIDGGILDDDRLRIIIIGMIFLLAFAALLFRLAFLQLNHGDEHRQLINKQSERVVRIPGIRGNIYSADGMVLAGNRQSYDLLFFPGEMHKGSRKKTVAYMLKCASEIARIIGRKEYPSQKDFTKHLSNIPGVPMTVFRDLTPRELALVFEFTRKAEGIDIQPSPMRVYPAGNMAPHIIGYTRRADPSMADDRKEFRRYYNPDLLGKGGIEAAFDTLESQDQMGLKAFPGHTIIQVNNIGYAQKELPGKSYPIHGNDVILTIDSKAQKLAEELLGDQTGAFVVIDADNGDIICAATAPRYDLTNFSPRLDPAYYQLLLDDPERPLINRAFQGIYPPGSTIKPLMCLAFLEAGIDPRQMVYCPGEVKVGNTVIRCSAHRYYGDDMDMVKALEKSCNIYMIHHGTRIGLGKILPHLEAAGFGRKTGLPIYENSGDLPSDELKMQRYNMPWNIYDTALLSIGQGIISVTPLQLAVYTAAIANGGTVWQPRLVKCVRDKRGIIRYEEKNKAAGKLAVSEENLAIVREGMFRVVNSSGGSGRHARMQELKIYGKTGTAEIGTKGNIRNITHFIAFVTYENRTYALAVSIEDGRSGGRTCAPLAAEFFRRYLLK